jgi:hypothetical protein
MGEMDRQLAGRLRGVLSVMPTLEEQADAAVRADRVAGSLADKDADVRFGKCVTIFASQGLQTAVDHLLSWHLLFEAHAHPSFAHMTLLRSAFEGAIRCQWLVDGRVAPEERGRRGAMAHLEDLTEKRKFAESMTGPEAAEFAVPARRREIACARAMKSLGWTSGINVVDLFDQYVGEGWIWRVTSGFAHGREWALSSSTFEETVRSSDGRPPMVKVASSAEISINMTAVAIATLVTALGEYSKYHGLTRLT